MRGPNGAIVICAALVAIGGEGAAESGATVADLSVDWDGTHQKIVGFGGTMGWIHPHPEKQDEVFDLLFTKLGASLLRIRALGGEKGDESCLEPVNDNDDPDRFDWKGLPIRETEAKNARIIKAAQKRGVKTVLAVTWSPPGWMKGSGRRAGGGELLDSALGEYAELWAAYLIGMKREFGIDIPLVSIQNEPDMQYYYPTCGIDEKLYPKAMSAVIERLKREKLETRVLGPDTCRIYHVPDYVETMEKAKVSPRSPILTHLYDLSIPYERVDRDPERWRQAREFARRYGRALWLMETANYLSYGSERGSYDEALIWAQKIHHALVHGDCQVVCYWSLFFDKRGEALIYCAKSEDRKYEVTPKFYTSMNYFRFVRPGMLRCAARSAGRGLLVSAFRGEKSEAESRVIVAINPTRASKTVRLPGKTDERWETHMTTRTEECRRAGTAQGGAALDLPSRSVTTFVRGSGL